MNFAALLRFTVRIAQRTGSGQRSRVHNPWGITGPGSKKYKIAKWLARGMDIFKVFNKFSTSWKPFIFLTFLFWFQFEEYRGATEIASARKFRNFIQLWHLLFPPKIFSWMIFLWFSSHSAGISCWNWVPKFPENIVLYELIYSQLKEVSS